MSLIARAANSQKNLILHTKKNSPACKRQELFFLDTFRNDVYNHIIASAQVHSLPYPDQAKPLSQQ